MDDKQKEWLDTKADVWIHDIETPREWLKEALKATLHDSKRPLGMSDWAYSLALTMVPVYPEIVLEAEEHGPDDIEFTFDWDKFDEILNSTIDALIEGKP